MRLTEIALRNLAVRWLKMLFLVLGLVMGVATVVALTALTGAMREQVRAQFDEDGAKLVVAPYTEQFSLSYRGVAVASALSYTAKELPPGVAARLPRFRDELRLRMIAPKLLAVLPVDGRRSLTVGVSFAEELRANRHWEVGGRVPAGPDEALLGSAAARRLGKRPGDPLVVSGTVFHVAGVLAETGGQEDPLVFLALPRLQALLKKPETVSFLELRVPRSAAERTVETLRQALPEVRVTAVKDQGEARREVVDRFARFSSLIMLVVLAAGALIVGTTMMSSVNERTREIGIFRAVGFRQSHIMRIILTEAAVVSGLGGAAGYLVGMTVASLAAPYAAQLREGLRWNPLVAVVAILLSLLAGLAASLYPARRAARLDPARALRFL